MAKTFDDLIWGYQKFRKKYTSELNPLMKKLANQGQKPRFLFVSCSDSRVDPALLLQCDPGDLFVVRNVANIIPPYETDGFHHGTSAALEFGLCYLEIEELVIFGHSQCGGISVLLNRDNLPSDDFITHWIDLIKLNKENFLEPDDCAKESLIHSYQNALTFPWIKKRLDTGKLSIHLWFLEIKSGTIFAYSHETNAFKPL